MNENDEDDEYTNYQRGYVDGIYILGYSNYLPWTIEYHRGFVEGISEFLQEQLLENASK